MGDMIGDDLPNKYFLPGSSSGTLISLKHSFVVGNRKADHVANKYLSAGFFSTILLTSNESFAAGYVIEHHMTNDYVLIEFCSDLLLTSTQSFAFGYHQRRSNGKQTFFTSILFNYTTYYEAQLRSWSPKQRLHGK